jgi:hypothetical protein
MAAAFCAAQGDPQPQTPDTKPAQPSAPANPPAGQQAQPGDQDSAKDSQETKKDAAAPKATSNDRLFFTLPNFLTLENAGQVPPLTTGQKFKVVARSSFDYVQYPWYGFLAGISQAQDSEEGYGQGAKGYAKRFGAYFADGTIENFMTGAIVPSVLHQDPRYFQSGRGGFSHRAGYAVSRIFVTRTDSGHEQFNFSEIFGSALAAGISTYSYHPREDRTLPNAVSVWGTQVGYDTITLVVKEFWPDIRRKMKKQPH